MRNLSSCNHPTSDSALLSPSLRCCRRRRPRLPAAAAAAPPRRRPAASASHDDVSGALVGELDGLLDAADALLARLEEDEDHVVPHLEDGHQAAAHAQPHYAADVGHEPSFTCLVRASSTHLFED